MFACWPGRWSRRIGGLAGTLAVASSLGACAGTEEASVRTVTVTSASHDAPKRVPRRSTTSPVHTFVRCDANIQAKATTTTCPFAQNVFWHYWKSDQAESLSVYSPALKATLATRCRAGEAFVVCTTRDGGMVRFSQAAIDSYSDAEADAYADRHDLGPDPTSPTDPSPSEPAPSPEPPSGSGGDIPNYANGRGYRVQCEDGMYSHSGGISGACSGHGGVR